MRYKRGIFTVTKITIMENNTNTLEQVGIWKPIEGYEGLYEVSSNGLVRSLDRYGRGRGDVDSIRIFRGKVLFMPIYRALYHSVSLCKHGKVKRCYTHRLVALTFIPNPKNKEQVNHIDGNKLNNNVSNLEWVTPSENATHAVATGLSKIGVLYPRSTLTAEQVVAIYMDNRKPKELSMVYPASADVIQKIKSGIAYRSITTSITR